ncbi:probable thimet oligopeptidase [Carica papaya]|uniref:probable thimet oligopeptidase n=1 Tax=Carica papaya TaxID=3649 RepID=UPI000B8CA9DE|nr:probable thimet oligopeptidase [Carica papaya]
MSPESKNYIQCLIRDFERNGLNLTMTKRKEVECLRNQIHELSCRYIRNLNDDDTFLLFSEDELAGLPPDFLKSFDKDRSGKFKITLKSNNVAAVMELCKIGTTRRLVAVAYGKKCGEVNLSALESLVQQRHKLARLLGYPNYAEYAVDNRMAKTSSKVFEFLEDISASLDDLAMREIAMLRDLKRKEEGDVPFGIQDLLYYIKKVEEQQFDLDFGAIKQYFPVSLVLSGIFKISQDLFGFRLEEISDAEVWHSDVQVFSVFDLVSGELLGYFYLDIYTREGKYGHTCVVALQNGTLSFNGARQIPVALLISHIEKNVGGDSGLLRFSEVVNLFHEFGHVVQHISNRASFARFSGLRVDPDFVEIPAQLLENWCYESFSLKLISGFHQDITKPIKDEVCKSLKRWRHSFSGLKLKQEVLYCLFDQIIHSTENIDFVELFKHLHPKVMLGLPALEGTNPASCFQRTAIGFEAACYSRIWSEVFAADIFASRFCDGILNQYVGMQFRSKVLAPGGAKEPVELLADFLGREPSIQAFIDGKTEYSL